jgi:hypothetical protein
MVAATASDAPRWRPFRYVKGVAWVDSWRAAAARRRLDRVVGVGPFPLLRVEEPGDGLPGRPVLEPLPRLRQSQEERSGRPTYFRFAPARVSLRRDALAAAQTPQRQPSW